MHKASTDGTPKPNHNQVNIQKISWQVQTLKYDMMRRDMESNRYTYVELDEGIELQLQNGQRFD